MSNRLEIPERRELPATWIELRKDWLVDELSPRSRPRRSRRRRLTLVLVPAVVVVLAATAFTTYALTRNVKHLESIGCYDSASLSANTAVVDADGRSPVAICAEAWRQGAFGSPPPKQLVACVLQTGAVGVFPASGADTCGALGLSPLPASYAAEARRFAHLRAAIEGRLGTPASGASKRGPQCVGGTEAVSFVRATLAANGYRGWRVQVMGSGFTEERPCAEPAYYTSAKTVYLFPVPR